MHSRGQDGTWGGKWLCSRNQMRSQKIRSTHSRSQKWQHRGVGCRQRKSEKRFGLAKGPRNAFLNVIPISISNKGMRVVSLLTREMSGWRAVLRPNWRFVVTVESKIGNYDCFSSAQIGLVRVGCGQDTTVREVQESMLGKMRTRGTPQNCSQDLLSLHCSSFPPTFPNSVSQEFKKLLQILQRV